MADHATPNLPAIDFVATHQFYTALGFETGWRDGGWMILRRGGLTLEFFPFADLNPAESSFGCCLRLDDLQALYDLCLARGIPEQCWGWPRLKAPAIEASGLRIGYLVDLNGTLLRLIQNP